MNFFGITDRSYRNLKKTQIPKNTKKPEDYGEGGRLLHGPSIKRKKTVINFVKEKLLM